MTQRQPPPWEQLRPWPDQDPGFRLDPSGNAQFRYAGHRVDVHVRYTTEEDHTRYSATGDDDNAIIFATVDVAGVTVGRSWWVTDWNNPYSMRDALAYVLKEATGDAERKVDEMAAELGRLRTKRTGVPHAANECPRCEGGPLADIVGHDPLGHRTVKALREKDVTTVDEVRAKGVAWVLDSTSVGTQGINRLAERLGLDMGKEVST
jgi:hypothetical protein